jgi:tRNA threonylcarbamoyladenosine biosynthesis protein TsaB
MIRALAIETSGRIGSVAFAGDGKLLEEETFAHGLQNAAGIVPAIDRLCRRQGCAPAELQELYVSAGPGSFTGLRIGITLAKTLALATGVRLVAVPTVRVLAENAPPEAGNIIIVLDAKRDQIFTAALRLGAEGWETHEPARLDTLTAMLARAPRPVYLLGEGIPYHQKFVPSDDPQIIISPADSWRARASAVADIGFDMARRGEFSDPYRLTPIYIRRPEAEEKADEADKHRV